MTAASARRRIVATGALLTIATLLVSCAGNTEEPAPAPTAELIGQAELDAALEEGGELDFWAWGVQYEKLALAFQEAYPNVKVNYLNPGNSGEQNTKVQNAIAAGSGIPDVIQIESQNLAQFALTDALIGLNAYDLDLENVLTPAALQAVTVGGEQVALPMDSGPQVMFYREDIFEAQGLDVPTTWEEYEEAARTLRAADLYIAENSGTMAAMDALIWASGGRPFEVDGETLSIDFTQPETQRVADLWTTLVEDDLIATSTPSFSPEWTTAMAAGKYATWVVGAWGVGSLQNRFPESAGLWRIAPIPTWEDSDATGVQGGSSLTALEGGDDHVLAVAFAQWMATSEEANALWVELAGIPVTTAVQSSSEWLDFENPYFGGQQVNQEIAAAFDRVGEGWSFLPFMPYASSIYADFVGTAFQERSSIGDALSAYGDALSAYGTSQGFTVK